MKTPFDILELQKIIEEKRLVYGQKLENFLLLKLKNSANFLWRNFCSFFQMNYSAAIICLAVILCGFWRNHNTENILFEEIFNYSLGAISIYFCNEILRHKNQPQFLRQLLTLTFCFAYFFRINDFSINEFSNSNYLLALIFPYICCRLDGKASLAVDAIRGILAALIICLDFYFVILILAFEIRSKNIINLRNAITIVLVLILCLFAPFPLHKPELNLDDFIIFKEAIFPVIFFSILCFELIRKNQHLQILQLATFSLATIAILENSALITIFFALALSFICTTIFFIARENKINWKINWPFILLAFALPLFDSIKIFSAALNICLLWWIILLIEKKINWPLFLAAFISIALASFDDSQKFSWLFCALMMLVALRIYAKHYYNRAALIGLSLVLSYMFFLLWNISFDISKFFPT